MQTKRTKTTESLSDPRFGEGTKTTYTNRKGRVVKQTAHLEADNNRVVDVKSRYKKDGSSKSTFIRKDGRVTNKVKYRDMNVVSDKTKIPMRNKSIDKLTRNR